MRFWRPAVIFVVGLALGVVAALRGPDLIGPYLPEALRPPVEVVEGEVTRKQREGQRLLLTVVTRRGALLATFRKQVAEVDLLVEQGDRLTLGLGRFQPFVDDPEIRQVQKQPAAPSSS